MNIGKRRSIGLLTFLTQNLSTILIGVILLAIVILVVVKLMRDRKKGKSSCGCGCSNCPNSSICHKGKS
nr:FeoB-associated Cys-rich membrane protein [uncultured Solibaculum sp.]